MNFTLDMLLHAHNQQYNDKSCLVRDILTSEMRWEYIHTSLTWCTERAKGSLSYSRICIMASMGRVFQTPHIYFGCFRTNSTIIIYRTKAFKDNSKINCKGHAFAHTLIKEGHIYTYRLLAVHFDCIIHCFSLFNLVLFYLYWFKWY